MAVHIDPIKPKLKPPGTKRLKLKCDILLSSFAFKFNLRRYIEAEEKLTAAANDNKALRDALVTLQSDVRDYMAAAAAAQVVGACQMCSPRHSMPFQSRNENAVSACVG
jgi:hypothetical protein